MQLLGFVDLRLIQVRGCVNLVVFVYGRRGVPTAVFNLREYGGCTIGCTEYVRAMLKYIVFRRLCVG